MHAAAQSSPLQRSGQSTTCVSPATKEAGVPPDLPPPYQAAVTGRVLPQLLDTALLSFKDSFLLGTRLHHQHREQKPAPALRSGG